MRTCSECGKEFCVSNLALWTYKVLYKSTTLYQCSYTCHDHVSLRKEGDKNYSSKESYKKLVKKNEDTMRRQGKKILHPIMNNV